VCNIAPCSRICAAGFVLFFTLIHCLGGNRVTRRMATSTAIAIYFVIWWVVLFMVLPWGVRSQEESGAVSQGTDPGAPAVPRLWWKLVWTTMLASVVFAVCAVVYSSRLVTLQGLAALLGFAN
jgi:predicted secreted protein